MKTMRLICLLMILGMTLLPVAAASSGALSGDEFNEITSLPAGASWWFSSTQDGSELGKSVASAGDVNGDGFDDVIIGAPKYEVNVYKEGAAMVFHGSPAGLGLGPAWQVGSGQQGAQFGATVAGIGDVNADGYDDVLVGSWKYNTTAGAVFIYYGSQNGLSTEPGWAYYNDQAEAEFGWSAASAGDINNDGITDLIVGATKAYQSDEDFKEGAVYVFWGTGDGFGTVPDQVLYGGDTNSQFGYSVASAGDLDKDGYDDIVVGAPNYTVHVPNVGAIDVGAVFSFLGSDSGLVPAANNPVFPGEPIIQDGARFGTAVSSAGDVNLDGYADVIVGMSHYNGIFSREGRTEIYLGGETGMSSLPNWTMTGGQDNAYFGISVSSVEVVSTEGFSGVLVGADGYSKDQPAEGRVFLYEINGDGLNTDHPWTADGNKADTEFGFSVSSAGDVDGDGLDDVLVGSPTYMNYQRKTGRAFAYYSSGTLMEPFSIFLPGLFRNNQDSQP